MNAIQDVPEFTRLIDLASEDLGGRVLEANDEFFASKENLLKAAAPVCISDKYTDHGKWMDGWETRRRRTDGHDWCIIKLAVPGMISGIDVDTSHFKGNHPPHVSLDAAFGTDDGTFDWRVVLPKSQVDENAHNYLIVDEQTCWSHVRLNIFPDGGVARLRVFGTVIPTWPNDGQEMELSAVRYGGVVLDCSDEHYGQMGSLLVPTAPENIGGGWETKRRRGPGHDWVVVQLGALGSLTRIEVDTTHFKGNYPDRVSFEGCTTLQDSPSGEGDWESIIEEKKLQPDDRHEFSTIKNNGPFNYVRMNIFPDGGIARVRVFGTREEGDG